MNLLPFFGKSGISASGGDSVYTINVAGQDYRVHEFTSSGNFIVSGSGEVEYLIVAGGGGGSSYRGSGGGAGGMEESTVEIESGTYPVIVGVGGLGGENGTDLPASGTDSSFAGNTVTGGGRAGVGGDTGNSADNEGGDGESGGGGHRTAPGGNGILGQGTDGQDTSTFFGKPGGGAGTGSNTTHTRNGRSSSITGTSVTYAEGGEDQTSSAGSVDENTGNGADGVNSGTGQKGADGIVIIRYPI